MTAREHTPMTARAHTPDDGVAQASPCVSCSKRVACRAPCDALTRLIGRPVPFSRDLPLFEHCVASNDVRDDEPGPWARTVAQEAPRLRDHLTHLPSRERAVLRGDLEGQSSVALALALGTSTAVVGRLRAQGLERLRVSLLPSLAASMNASNDGPGSLTFTPHAQESTMSNTASRSHDQRPRAAQSSSTSATTREEGTAPKVPRCTERGCRRAVSTASASSPSLAALCDAHRRLREQARKGTLSRAEAAVAPPSTLADHEAAAALCSAVEGIDIVIAEVTPALALALLERNVTNRPVARERVDAYARDMLDGAWRANNQGIALGSDGTLYDGQHRLRAVVQANVPVRMVIARGLDVSTRATIDQGRVRSVGDTLRMLDGEEQGARVVSWVRAIETLRGRGSLVLSPHTARIEIERYRVSIDWMLKHGPRGRLLTRASIVGALVYAHHVLGEEIVPMLLGYAHGTDLSAGSPALALRTYVTERLRVGTDRDRAQSLKALRCAIAHVRGESIERMQATEEGYDHLRRIEEARATTPDDAPTEARP